MRKLQKSSDVVETPFILMPELYDTFSGTKVCTGDFTPPEPEFRPEFCETNFGRPKFEPEFLGRIF